MTCQMPSQEAGTPIPATVLVRRRARPGCEHQLQDWAEALCADARDMPGYMASESFRSPVEFGGELLLGMTFASAQDLLRWTDSAQRASRLASVAEITEGGAHAVPVDMLAWTLQTPSSTPATQGPVPRWASAFIVWLAIYPSAMLIAVLVGPALDGWHIALRTLVTTGLLVPFMVYIAVPLLQRLLHPWLRHRA